MYEEGTPQWFRLNVMLEVLNTEREYVRDLSLMVELYVQPLRQLSHGVTAFRDPGQWDEKFEELRRMIAPR